jgi:hypothetical protein
VTIPAGLYWSLTQKARYLIIGSKGPLSKTTTVAQPWRRELVFMPETVGKRVG